MIDLLRWAPAPGALYRLAAEGALVGLFTISLAVVVGRVGRAAERDGSEPLSSSASGVGAIVGLVGGVVGVWLIAQDTTKGQTLAAAVMGGMFAACAGRLAAVRSPAIVYMIVACVLGVVGPFTGAILHGGDALRAIYESRFVHLALPTPLDWAAGALLGVPLGLNIAGSLMERKQNGASSAATT